MSLRVLRPGLLTTLQDLGRPGRQQYGVPVGGAMDRPALRIANWLVGNDEKEAALECTLQGPTLQFERDALVALTGSLVPWIDGHALPLGRPVLVRRGSVLSLSAVSSGCRGYLAVAGGYDVPHVLGSRSTYLRAGIGGLEGRALRLGDLLPLGEESAAARRMSQHLLQAAADESWFAAPWSLGPAAAQPTGDSLLRVLLGSHFAALTDESQQRLWTADFAVTPQSDRMGYRLSSRPLEFRAPLQVLSSAVSPGAIQLPPDGQPIILLADCATTGGYPVIAHVASVDLPRLAQCKPGDSLRLRAISLDEAQAALRAAEADLQRLRVAIELKFAFQS